MILDKKAMQKHTFLLAFFGQNEHLSQLLGNAVQNEYKQKYTET